MSNPKISKYYRWADYLIFGLTVFLVFCLLFESRIGLPALVGWLGRWHPLLLHFPIVLLLVAVFLSFTKGGVPRLLLAIAVLSALVTAVTGFLLGMEPADKGLLLTRHQWLGTGVTLLAVVWYVLESQGLGRWKVIKVLQILLVVMIGFAGHYGGMVTHGEEFLALPGTKERKKIPENPLIYGDIVTRVLDNNCVSCHNPDKQKGELVMATYEDLMAGGKSGNTIVPGDVEKSELIMRLHLPPTDEDHMPPESKKPLSDSEIQILERWIALGASDTLKLDQLPGNEPLAALVNEMRTPDPMGQWAGLPFVADSTLENLGSDYLTIKRVAGSSNALVINMYMPPEYDPRLILDLKRIAPNIVELDLSGLPIGEKEMGLIALCGNLDRLEIDRTPVTDADMGRLKGLSKLRLLKVYQTGIGDGSLQVLESLPDLKKLYLWRTGVTESGLEGLKAKRPALLVDDGIEPKLQAFFEPKDST
ncbi:hypothetical protein K8352_19235, partial [Flavobacteriaceae bacterium F89]